MGSEAETVMEEDDGSGDATLVLRKIMEERKKSQLKARNPRHHRYVSDNTPRGNSQYSSSTNISPTTVTDQMEQHLQAHEAAQQDASAIIQTAKVL
jgi:hypothetical protein